MHRTLRVHRVGVHRTGCAQDVLTRGLTLRSGGPLPRPGPQAKPPLLRARLPWCCPGPGGWEGHLMPTCRFSGCREKHTFLNSHRLLTVKHTAESPLDGDRCH